MKIRENDRKNDKDVDDVKRERVETDDSTSMGYIGKKTFLLQF